MIYPGELFDGGQVGGRPIKSGKVLRDPPGDGLMLQGLGLTGFYGAAVGAERNIIVNGCGDFIADGDDAAEFFTDFPFEGYPQFKLVGSVHGKKLIDFYASNIVRLKG